MSTMVEEGKSESICHYWVRFPCQIKEHHLELEQYSEFFTLNWTWHTGLFALQGELCIGIMYVTLHWENGTSNDWHIVLEKLVAPNTRCVCIWRAKIGQKCTENAITGYIVCCYCYRDVSKIEWIEFMPLVYTTFVCKISMSDWAVIRIYALSLRPLFVGQGRMNMIVIWFEGSSNIDICIVTGAVAIPTNTI